MAQITFYKLSCNFKSDRVYDPELVHADEYSFGMLAGARAWVERHRDELVWYSITGLEAIPCDELHPEGQLYYGVIYHDFEWLDKEAAM